MDFFKKRIRKYQEKKLDEITSKIQFHQYTKKQLEQKIEEMINNEKTAIPFAIIATNFSLLVSVTICVNMSVVI